MSVLHIVNKSLLNSACLKECLRFVTAKDAVLLIEDGVYAADQHFAVEFDQTPASLWVLAADVEARGLVDRLNPQFTVVNDQGFVELVTTHSKSQSWY